MLCYEGAVLCELTLSRVLEAPTCTGNYNLFSSFVVIHNTQFKFHSILIAVVLLPYVWLPADTEMEMAITQCLSLAQLKVCTLHPVQFICRQV